MLRNSWTVADACRWLVHPPVPFVDVFVKWVHPFTREWLPTFLCSSFAECEIKVHLRLTTEGNEINMWMLYFSYSRTLFCPVTLLPSHYSDNRKKLNCSDSITIQPAIKPVLSCTKNPPVSCIIHYAVGYCSTLLLPLKLNRHLLFVK